MWTTKTLLRLRGCTGLFESSLWEHVKKYVFSRCGSFICFSVIVFRPEYKAFFSVIRLWSGDQDLLFFCHHLPGQKIRFLFFSVVLFSVIRFWSGDKEFFFLSSEFGQEMRIFFFFFFYLPILVWTWGFIFFCHLILVRRWGFFFSVIRFWSGDEDLFLLSLVSGQEIRIYISVIRFGPELSINFFCYRFRARI